MVELITGDSCLDKVLTETRIVVVDFFAEWCGPCRAIKPTLEQWALELNSRVKFVQIDVDVDKELAKDAEIEAMPTLVIFKKGKTYKKVVGADMKKVRLAIEELLQKAGRSERCRR